MPPILHESFARVREQLSPVLVYLDRLRVRLEMRGRTPADPVLRAKLDAHAKMQALTIQLHYDSCTGGVGRSE